MFATLPNNFSTRPPPSQAWAVMEGSMGDLARARELVLEGLRIDPYHGALWTVYSIIERQDGSEAKARKVFYVRVAPTPHSSC